MIHRRDWSPAALMPALGSSMTLRRAIQFLPFLLLVVQPLIFFHKVLFNPARQIPYDILGWHFPLASVLARGFKLHEWPFWDPGQYCGMPYFADLQTQQYYPPAWFALLLGNANGPLKAYYAYEWLIPIHMVIAGLLAYGLFRHLDCRRGVALFGATVYQLGAFYASQAQHLGAACCAAWLPLCVWALFQLSEKVTALGVGLLSLGLTLCFLSGFPGALFPVLAVLLIVAAGLIIAGQAKWTMLVGMACSLVLAGLAVMVQLAPSLVLTRLSIASLRSGWIQRPTGLPLESLVSFVLPNYYHYFDGYTGSYKLSYNFTFLHTYCGHAAVLLLLLIPFVRRTRLLWISLTGIAASVIVMLGSNGYLYLYIHRILPDLLRGSIYCEYFLIAFTWFVAMTAALVLKALLESGEKRVRGHPRRPGGLPHAATIAWAVALGTTVNLLTVGPGTALNSQPFSKRFQTTSDSLSGDKAAIHKLHEWLDVSIPQQRVDFVFPEFTELRGRAELLNLHSATGDNPFMLLRLFHLRALFTDADPIERTKQIASLRSHWIDALNIGVLAQTRGAPPLKEEDVPPGKYEVSSLDSMRLYRNLSPLPRFYFVGAVRRALDEKEALSIAADPSFDPAKEAIVEGLPGSWQGGPVEKSSVRVTRYSNNSVTLQSVAAAPLFLVSSEANYPGWLAEIDGKPVALYQTNVAFRGLTVPAGNHTISMHFQPEHYGLWLLLTVIGLTVILGLIFWSVRRAFKAWAQDTFRGARAGLVGQVAKLRQSIPSGKTVWRLTHLRWTWWTAAACSAAVYLTFGLALLHGTGVEADEVIFVPLLAHAREAMYHRRFLDITFPLMSMTYLGTLKWFIYKPIFALFGMTVAALRVPMMLIAAATLFMLAWLLNRLASVRAVFCTTLLLATDRGYLVTTVWDWGPVVLQMFFQAAALICFVRWYDSRKLKWLLLAGLAVGLGLWDKALFVWFFSSLCVAAVLFAGRTIYQAFSLPRLASFLLGFVAGAMPLILFNIHSPNATFGSNNSSFSLSFVPAKTINLERSINGISLVDTFTDTKRPATSPPKTLATQIDRWARVPTNWRIYLFLLVPLALFFCRGAARVWIAIFFAAGWLTFFQMAITKDAGAALHHYVLAYPLWFAAIGLAADRLSARLNNRSFATLVTLVAIPGALQLNSCVADLSRFSDASQWTDATPALADFVRSRPGVTVWVVDWGLRTPLLFHYRLQLPVRDISFAVSMNGNLKNEGIGECALTPCIAVAFAPGRDMFPGAATKFVNELTGSGVHTGLSREIKDTKGVPAYNVFDLVPDAPPQAPD